MKLARGMLLIFICLHGLQSTLVYAESMTRSKFEQVIQEGNTDQVLDAINEVNKLHYQGDILPVIVDLFDQKKEKYRQANWNIMVLPVVRVELANILLQAQRNNLLKANTGHIQKFLHAALKSSDTETASRALLALAVIDDEKDVEVIMSIAVKEDKRTFRYAVTALSKMCNIKAMSALKTLSGSAKNVDSREFIQASIENARRLHEIGWCLGVKKNGG